MPSSDGLNVSSDPAPYRWTYEYYDDEEPVSFEGLGAHRYSIVIGFWVGLAVFVIFMFFLLTLLAKTGAPHPDSSGQPCETRPRLTGCVDNNPINEAPPPCPSTVDSSCSIFQCCLSKKVQEGSRVLWTRVNGSQAASGDAPVRGDFLSSSLQVEELEGSGNGPETEVVLPADFNIPNFVRCEQSLPDQGAGAANHRGRAGSDQNDHD